MESTAPSAPWWTSRQACALLLSFGGLYWLWVALAGQSITTDPAISILAAQGILEHGYPRLPSGFIYDRAYVPNYALALSIRLFGLNDFAVAFPSLLMGLGSLYFTWRIGRDILGRAGIGLAAAALLISLEGISHYAASPRMYMALQFFTVWAVYSAWRGYVLGSVRHRVFTLLAVAGAFLSHQQGGILALGIPLTVLVVLRLDRGRFPSATDLKRLAPFALLAVLVVIDLYFEPPGSMRSIAMSVPEGGMSGLNLRPRRWLAHANWLEQLVPLGMLFAPALAWLVIRTVRRLDGRATAGTLYLMLLFGFWAIGVFGYIRVEGIRFWVGIAPVYILLVFQSALLIAHVFTEPASSPPRRRFAWAAVLILWGAAIVTGYSTYYGWGAYPEIIRAGYGPPCPPDDLGCSVALESAYRIIEGELGAGDLVISTNPFVANYYLGRVDGWLVQRRVGSERTGFQSDIDEYFGVDLVDREAELDALSHQDQRVWVIVENDSGLDGSMMSQLARAYQAREVGPLSVYVSPDGTH